MTPNDNPTMTNPNSRSPEAVDYGVETVTVGNRYLSVRVHPGHGAKVSSFTDLRSGRNWLATTGRRWAVGSPAKWEDSDRAGWDECVPNISAGPHPDAKIQMPDHGEAWSRPWTIRNTGPDRVSTQIRGRVLPYELTRDIQLTNETATMTYQLTNHGPVPMHIGWAMHMLVETTPRAVRLPPETAVRVDSTFGRCGPVIAGEGWTTWGELANQLPMSDSGWACKAFTQPGALTTVDVLDSGALTVSITDPPRPAAFGLWLNAGGWPSNDPLHHVGIEPGFGDHDDLVAAKANMSILTLNASATASWKVNVRASDRSPASAVSGATDGRAE